MKKPLSRRIVLSLFGGLALALAAPNFAAAATPPGAPAPDSPGFAEWVLNYVDDMHRGDQSHGVLEMKVKTANWTRTMAMEAWSKGKDYSLIRILAPKKERGTATLKAKDNLFTYLGKTGRTIKITGGMMGGQWMGSHFTNDDLVRESRLSEDFEITTTFVGSRSGTKVYEFTATAKPDAPVVWGKVVSVIRQDDLLPLEQIYYDEDGEKVRHMLFSDFRTLSGRVMPLKMRMEPLDGSGEYTEIVYKKMDFSVELDANFFSLQKLKAL